MSCHLQETLEQSRFRGGHWKLSRVIKIELCIFIQVGMTKQMVGRGWARAERKMFDTMA